MTKPKTLEQLRAEKERAETQLAQEKHMPETRKTGRTRPFLPVISFCKDFYKEKRFTA